MMSNQKTYRTQLVALAFFILPIVFFVILENGNIFAKSVEYNSPQETRQIVDSFPNNVLWIKTCYAAFVNFNNLRSEKFVERVDLYSVINLPVVTLLVISLVIIVLHFAKKLYHDYLDKLNHLKEKNRELKNEIQSAKYTYQKLCHHFNHEFRNSINSIKGSSALFNEHYSSLSESERDILINSVSNSTSLLQNQIDALIKWSDLETDAIDAESDLFDISYIITHVIKNLDADIVKKNINMKTDIPDELMIYMDMSRLQFIVHSMIHNAIKYSFADGEVFIKAQIKDGIMEIAVDDKGAGISEENINKLFNADQIFNNTGTEGEKGTGLSLIISYKYAKEVNGDIIVSSKEHKGSCVKLIIPISSNYNG